MSVMNVLCCYFYLSLVDFFLLPYILHYLWEGCYKIWAILAQKVDIHSF